MINDNQTEARAARREYMRRWRADHPEAVRAAQARYWAKKAAEMKETSREQDEGKDEQ